MAISDAATLKNRFKSGDAPTSGDFTNLIDTAVRPTLIAIATAAENGGTGLVVIESQADVTTRPAGTVGLQILSTQTTASALSIVPVAASAATTAEVGNHTVVTGKYVSPGYQQYSPFGVRAYAAWNSAGTIQIQSRVSAIAKPAVGSFRITWAKAMPTASYAFAGMASTKEATDIRPIIVVASSTAQAQTASAMTVKTFDDAASQVDPNRIVCITVFCSGP